MTGRDLREQVRDFQSTLEEIRRNLREQGGLLQKKAKLLSSINQKCHELILIIPVKKEDYETVERVEE